MKEKLRFINRSIPALINRPQHKIPVTRIDRSFQRDRIADLPAIFGRKLPARHRAFAVKQKSFLLLFVKNKFRVQGKIGMRFDAEIRKEILFIDIDATEPVAPGYRFNAFESDGFFRCRKWAAER